MTTIVDFMIISSYTVVVLCIGYIMGKNVKIEIEKTKIKGVDYARRIDTKDSRYGAEEL